MFTGKLCDIDIDECASRPCVNGGTCINDKNGYSCACPFNYAGKNCERVQLCTKGKKCTKSK